MIVHKDYQFLPLVAEDREFYLSIYRNQQVMSYVMEIPDKDTSERFFFNTLQQSQRAEPEKLVYTIRRNRQPIGLIGLYWNQTEKNVVELGTLMATAYQSKGYGSEATLGLAHYALSNLGIKQVVLISELDNHLATRSAQKMGFRRARQTEKNRLGRTCNRWILERF